MATLKDIAQIIGVTQGMVPRVLNQDPTSCVTGEARERVMRITGSLGYKKNIPRATSSAPTKQEKRIGVVQMFDMEELQEDICYLALKNILDEGCFSRRWITVSLYRDEQRHFIRRDQAPPDGLFATGRFTQREVAGFHEYTDNIVFLDSDPGPVRYYSISPNCHLAVQLALGHLRINGHQLTVYLGDVNTFGDHKRLAMDSHFYCYRASQADRGSYDPSLVLDCEINAKSGYAAMRNFSETYGRPPEAMFIASNSIAPGAMMALWERGLRVSEGISIATFDNTVLSEYSDPSLTSIELFMHGNVRAAVLCIWLLWQGNVRGKRIVIPCELAFRGSVVSAPTDSPPSEL